MSKLFRQTAALLAIAAGLAVAPKIAAAPLAIAVARTPLSLPLYVAEAEGYFKEAGLATRLVDCVGGHVCIRLVFDGSAQIATASDSVVMFQSFERDDYVVLGTLVTTDNDVKLIGRKDAGIAAPGQLAGKRIGFVHGASSQFFLDSYLLLHGVDPRSLRLVELQPDQMAEALRSAQVDAVAIWEPFAYAAVDAMKGGATVLPHSGAYKLTFNLITLRRFASANDSDLIRFMRAVQRAEVLIREQPQRAQAILRARLGVDQRFVEWVWPGLEYRLSLDQSLIKTLESEARWAIREGYVRGALPNYLRYLHPSPLGSVNPAAIGLSN